MATNLCRFMQALKRTHRILTHDVRLKILPLASVERCYTSALYISGKLAHKVFAFLTPHLDVDERFANMDKLQKELALRRTNIDVNQLKEVWEFYCKINADKYALEEHHTELVNRMKVLRKNTERTPEMETEILKLGMQLHIVRDDLKTMKYALWEMDDNVMERILKLPNELDPRTPTEESVVLKSVGIATESSSEKTSKSHIDIGTNLDLLEYKNPINYFLCGDAALFELGVLAHVSRILGDNNMIRVAGADFSRSLVVEGSGLNHEDPATVFTIEDHEEVERGSPNRMHLVGGASLVSFLALHTKQMINPNDFPLKYFAMGRQYMPLPRDARACGLFTACQASVAQVFLMVKDAKSEEYRTLFEELVTSVCRLYDDLCDHYRVVMRPASELQSWEGLRVSFELWSPFANQYIEVGHVSACGDYFSKRLLITYQTPTGRKFPAAISGTILSVPRLLACLLEQNPDKFVIPPKVAELMPKDDYITM